jgi:Flp pilus assembly pilin Flp
MINRILFRYLRDRDRGASMVEYALLVVLIAVVAFVAVQLAGNAVSESFVEIADELGQAGS